jgi:two-component system, NarL family, response regulator LiaR
VTEVIRVLLADDHKLVRSGIRALLQVEAEFEVIGEAADGQEAIEKARLLNPDVILLDLQMPRKTGIQAIEEIKRENSNARILVLTTFDDDSRVFAAIKVGALGYLLKEARMNELFQAIRDVYNGEYALHPSIARRLIQELKKTSFPLRFAEPLTDREEEVLILVARGLANQEIARLLLIRERTVSTHVSNILNKLHLANRTQATLYALREGLVTLEEVYA